MARGELLEERVYRTGESTGIGQKPIESLAGDCSKHPEIHLSCLTEFSADTRSIPPDRRKNALDGTDKLGFVAGQIVALDILVSESVDGSGR